MRRLMGLMLVASATAGAQVAVGGRTTEMPQPDFNGRPTSTYFTLGVANPTGALKAVGETGYQLGLSIQRSFGPQHFIGWGLALPLAAGAESADATTGWTFLS